MRARFVLIVTCCALVGACSLSPPKTWKNNYALRPLPAPAEHGHHKASPVPVTLRVAAVDAPNWLASRDMYYQLNYSNRNTISAYSESRWLAPPPVMVQRLLLEGLSDAGDWEAVIGANDNARADYVLRIHLLQFQQIFSTRQKSFGLLMARGTLIDARHDAVRAQRTFRFEVRAATADTDGGARALSEASHDLVAAVRQWLRAVVTGSGGLAGERRPQ